MSNRPKQGRLVGDVCKEERGGGGGREGEMGTLMGDS